MRPQTAPVTLRGCLVAAFAGSAVALGVVMGAVLFLRWVFL